MIYENINWIGTRLEVCVEFKPAGNKCTWVIGRPTVLYNESEALQTDGST